MEQAEIFGASEGLGVGGQKGREPEVQLASWEAGRA